MIDELNERSRVIFAKIVESFFENGDPVGSRTLSQLLPMNLSPATVRNVMADLEDLGLLYAPHPSAGRLPTDLGLRLFVDGLLEVGDLAAHERESIESQCVGDGRAFNEVLGQATEMLSGLTGATGLVLAPKSEAPVRHVEFVGLEPGKALAIMVLTRRPGGKPRDHGSPRADSLDSDRGGELSEHPPRGANPRRGAERDRRRTRRAQGGAGRAREPGGGERRRGVV